MLFKTRVYNNKNSQNKLLIGISKSTCLMSSYKDPSINKYNFDIRIVLNGKFMSIQKVQAVNILTK